MTALEWARTPSRARVVVLTRTEAFELCEILAEAERSLARAGRDVAGSRLGAAFELLEDRLFGDQRARSRPASGEPVSP